MKIYTAPHELNERGLWDKYCEITGTSIWAMNEGLIDSNEDLEVPEEMLKYFKERNYTYEQSTF